MKILLVRYLVVFLLLGAAAPFFISSAFAATDCQGIIITEVMPNPEGSDSGEWVEIYNPIEETKIISNCFVGDLIDSNKVNLAGFPAISSGSYLKIPMNKAVFNNSDGDTVRLFDTEGDIDIVHYAENADEGKSYAFDGTDWYWTPIPTPGEPNEFDQDQPVNADCSSLTITELMPNSEESDSDNEWIEVFNQSSVTINLGGCILSDRLGSVREFIIPNNISLGAGIFAVFYSQETGISLNNDGDGVNILDQNRQTVFETSLYKGALEGLSFASFSSGWAWTKSPTPGGNNIFTTTETTKKPTTTKVKKTTKKVSQSQTTKSKTTSTHKTDAVLGETNEKENNLPANEDNENQKITNSILGYFLIGFAFVFVLGSIIYLNKAKILARFK